MWGLAALATAAMPANNGPVQASTRQVVYLSGPRVSFVDDARTVVTFEATGDIRGLLTLTLVPGGAGSVRGEWALVSRYVKDLVTGADELPVGREGEPEPEESPAWINRGTINGPISGGVLGFDPNGQLSSIDSVKMEVVGGNLEFEGAKGSGSASAVNMQDINQGNGTVVLAMEVGR
jgi:hypothetical protein